MAAGKRPTTPSDRWSAAGCRAPRSGSEEVSIMWTRERNTPSPDRAPNQLPLLQRGHHRRPEDGACVMEYVSVLAGGKFTDHPRCTHPALATLAPLGHDWLRDHGGSSQPAATGPDLIDTGRGDL